MIVPTVLPTQRGSTRRHDIMDTTTNIMDNNTMDANNMQLSSLLKLFGDDPDGKLQELRDKIYSHVWSRGRRDQAKLDWVLSQNGVNRNVPERFIDDTRYGPPTFESIHENPCGLILANKEISADFTRYIYSVNHLEIDVDLKATNTAENEAKLHRIITLLQNTNFVRYTRRVRVRIHFPDKYPFQALPAFNQRALENIAVTLDGFEQIEHLAVRVVSMQGPMEYELRLASFPFYPMSLTNWSIRLLNDTTLNWDIVGGEQLHELNLAWDVYQATGSLTARVNTGAAEENSVPGGQTFNEMGTDRLPKNHVTTQHKNGSQKRKARKMRGVSAVATNTGFASTTQSVAETSSPSSPAPAPPSIDGLILLSDTQLPEGCATSRSRLTALEPFREPSEGQLSSEPPVKSAFDDPSKPHSPSLTPMKPLNMKSAVDLSASDTSGELIMTPCDSSVASPGKRVMTIPITQPATKAANMDEFHELTDFKAPQTSCPPSPTPCSVTGGQSLNDDDTLPKVVRVPDGAAPFSDGLDNKEPPQKKKRRSRKKPKKSKAADPQAISFEGAEGEPAAAGVQLNKNANGNDISLVEDRFDEGQEILGKIVQELQIVNGKIYVDVTADSDVPLAGLTDLEPLFDGFCIGTKADGTRLIIRRTKEASWHLRQKERRMANRLEREAEMMKAKEKRQSKKIKEVFVRRRDPSQNLRRQIEDAKQQKFGKQLSCSNKINNQPDEEESNDMGNGSLTLSSRVGASRAKTIPDADLNPVEVSGELDDNDKNDAILYSDPTSHEYEHPQSSQLAASTHFPAQIAQNYDEWATAAMPTRDKAFRFEGQNIQAPTEQEMQEIGADHAGMNTLDKGMRSVYDNAALFVGVYPNYQNHRDDRRVEERRVIEEIDEPGNFNVLAAHSPDDEALSPRDGDGVNDEQEGKAILAG